MCLISVHIWSSLWLDCRTFVQEVFNLLGLWERCLFELVHVIIKDAIGGLEHPYFSAVGTDCKVFSPLPVQKPPFPFHHSLSLHIEKPSSLAPIPPSRFDTVYHILRCLDNLHLGHFPFQILLPAQPLVSHFHPCCITTQISRAPLSLLSFSGSRNHCPSCVAEHFQTQRGNLKHLGSKSSEWLYAGPKILHEFCQICYCLSLPGRLSCFVWHVKHVYFHIHIFPAN